MIPRLRFPLSRRQFIFAVVERALYLSRALPSLRSRLGFIVAASPHPDGGRKISRKEFANSIVKRRKEA
ncbi:hypothetical protein NL676_027737 [Syzygium grande]|nr:hypothetical protein NL676_027737 [Syzygium grande]